MAALGRARLDDWVAALPAGLDTHVGEGGRRLSAVSASASPWRAHCLRMRRC